MDRVTDTSKEAEDSISPHASHTMSEVTNLDKSGNQIVAEATSADDVEKQSDTQSLQAGVQRAEILRKGWTKKGLYLAFVGLFIATLAINFGDYSTQVYVPYTTSAFKQHSAMSAARVVMNITRIASYPIIAKLGDVAGIFEAIGSTGYALTQQVFVADVTNLVNRGIWSTLPDSLTTVPTLYLGTIVAQRMLDHSTWRWGWGMWAIITPVCAVPLIGTMLVYQRRAPIKVPIAKAMGWKETDTWYQRAYRLLWVELDLPGGVLLLLGLALLLVPIALTGSNNSNAWHKGNFIAMLVLGVVFLISFVIWDARFAKKPFVPYRMIKQRTVAAACLLGALDFFHYSVFSVFFTSYLQVAGHFNAGNATRIDNSLRVAFQVSGIFAAFFMKYTKRSQIWVLIGVPLCILGMGILLYLVDMGDGQTGNEAAFVTAKSLIGIGRGFYQTAAQVSVQAVVSRQEVSVVTAVFFASMSIGGAIGTSVAGAIWRSNLPRKLSMYLPDEAKGQAKSIFGSIVVAQKYPVGEPVRIAIDRSYRESQRLLAIAAIAALAPMLVIMFFLKNVRLDERQTAKEGGEEREMVEQKKGDAE
ncbi:hypothetical protein APSETT444_005502 [Aspergillus pseudonomiae]